MSGEEQRRFPLSYFEVTEQKRLSDARELGIPWKKWGPYLSERQWGTVREDYSADGNAWEYFSHDQSRSRAYRWGEDGLAGISDDRQQLCFALALWNGRDPILKERLFGLTNSEGNHGEDVKESKRIQRLLRLGSTAVVACCLRRPRCHLGLLRRRKPIHA